MSYRTILLFGGPGAGKGTQGKILGTIPGLFHFSSGDAFRAIRSDTEIGRLFAQYAGRGQLVPDRPTVDLWQSFIDSSTKSGRFHPDQDILVLDGIPRNVRQAEMMKSPLEVLAILNLRCARVETLIERLQRRALKENRVDDARIEVIRNRLEVYERETRPVLEFYASNLLHEIDAAQTPPKVLFDILSHLVKILAL